MTRQRPVTLAEVAARAGVSRSTASEALGGRGRMADRTREAVRAAAKELGYRPNALARGLRTGKTFSIGLHQLAGADTFAQQYVREFIAGAIAVAREHDYDLTVLSTHPDKPRPAQAYVDGIIIADPIADDIRARELLETGIPLVAGEVYPEGMPTSPVVGVDHPTVFRELLDHLWESGARRPLLVGADEKSGWGHLLREVYAAWCGERGIPAADEQVSFLSAFERSREDRLDEVVGRDFDALIVSSELTAMHAIEVLRAAGREPGVDVLLASCCDADVLTLTSPSVTAIDLGPRVVGATCARVLLDHLATGEPIPDLTPLRATLTVRKSTTPLS